MIEVSDMDEIRNQGRRADLDVEVTVHRRVPAEHDLVAHSERALVGSKVGVAAHVDPPAEDNAAVAAPPLDLCATPEEDHSLGDDLRVEDPQP